VSDNDLLQLSDLLNEYLKCLLETAYAPGNKPDVHTALLSGHISCIASSYLLHSSQLLTREQDSEHESTIHLPYRIIMYKEKNGKQNVSRKLRIRVLHVSDSSK